MLVYTVVTETALANPAPLPALSFPGPDAGCVGEGRARLLYVGVYQAACGDVGGEVGPVRPLDGRKYARRRRVRPAVAANVGDGAEILRNLRTSLVTRVASLARLAERSAIA